MMAFHHGMMLYTILGWSSNARATRKHGIQHEYCREVIPLVLSQYWYRDQILAGLTWPTS